MNVRARSVFEAKIDILYDSYKKILYDTDKSYKEKILEIDNEIKNLKCDFSDNSYNQINDWNFVQEIYENENKEFLSMMIVRIYSYLECLLKERYEKDTIKKEKMPKAAFYYKEITDCDINQNWSGFKQFNKVRNYIVHDLLAEEFKNSNSDEEINSKKVNYNKYINLEYVLESLECIHKLLKDVPLLHT